MIEYKQHELSKLFPSMSEDEYDELKESIAQHGLQNPIVIYEDMILDGWHRYKAAKEVGAKIIDIHLREFTELDNPYEFVLIANSARRHLSKSQKAMIYVRIREIIKRKKNGHYEKGPTEQTLKRGWKKSAPGADSAQSQAASGAGPTVEKVAKQLGVSKRTVEQAQTVRAKGSAEVIEAVEQGEITLKDAEQVVKLPVEDQAAALKEEPKKERGRKKKLPASPPPPEGAEDIDFEDAMITDAEVIEELKIIVAAKDAELKDLQNQIELLKDDNKSLSAKDPGAEILKNKMLYETARDRANKTQNSSAENYSKAKWATNQLIACARAVGYKGKKLGEIAQAVREFVDAAKSGKKPWKEIPQEPAPEVYDEISEEEMAAGMSDGFPGDAS